VTAVSNLALLCRRHHMDLHAGRWTVTITNGAVDLTRPTWADPPPLHPNPPDAPSRSTIHTAATPPPARLDPWGEEPEESGQTARSAPGSSGVVGSARLDPWGEEAGGSARSAARSSAASPSPARLDPWGEESDEPGQTARSSPRWADDAIRQDAARLAVRGTTGTSESEVGSSSPGGSVASGPAARLGPSDETAIPDASPARATVLPDKLDDSPPPQAMRSADVSSAIS
jgi:hypothetical protein